MLKLRSSGRRASTGMALPALTPATSSLAVRSAKSASGAAPSSPLAHVAGVDALCVGCLDLARLALVSCPVARSAARSSSRRTAKSLGSAGRQASPWVRGAFGLYGRSARSVHLDR